MLKHGCFVLSLSGSLDDSRRAEIVDLLNKGTHFDEMLTALKAIIGPVGPDYYNLDPARIAIAKAAIAKAKGT